MDLSVTRDTARVSEPVFDAVSDHPVDCDIILPDYCPDIGRILKTRAEACIETKTVESGRMMVGGTFSVRVIYVPENSHSIRCVTHETPFTHNFDFRDDGTRVHARAKVRVSFVNCRPVGPRRMQIRGSLAVSAKIWTEKDAEFVSGSDDKRVELLCRPQMASTLVGNAERVFTVSEELEMGYGKPAVGLVLKTEAAAVVQDYKLIANKVIAKGELLIRTLYVSDDDGEETGTLETMEHSIPLSQILDLEGVDDQCACDVRFIPGIVKAEPKQDSDGANKLLEFSLAVTATASAWRTRELFSVVDAYSPQYELTMNSRDIPFEHLSEQLRSNEIIRQSIELSELQIASIADISASANVTGVKTEGTAMEISGDMTVSILAVDSAGSPAGIEKTLPFTLRQELKNAGGSLRSDPEISVVSAGYSMGGGDRIDLRIETVVEAAVFTVSREAAVVELGIDEGSPKQTGREKTLTLYFADRGEKIWDIAKRYNTSMDAVKRENNLSADSLDDRCMLLIPKKRCAGT